MDGRSWYTWNSRYPARLHQSRASVTVAAEPCGEADDEASKSIRTPGGPAIVAAGEVNSADASGTTALLGGHLGSPGGIGGTCKAALVGVAVLPAAHDPSTRNSWARSQDSGLTLAGTRSLLPEPPLLGLLLSADASASSMAEAASTGALTRLTRRLRPPAASSEAAVAAAAAALLETTVGSRLRTALLSSTQTDSRPAAAAGGEAEFAVDRPAAAAADVDAPLAPKAEDAACSRAAAISSAVASEARKPRGCQPPFNRDAPDADAALATGEVKRERAAAAPADGDGAVLTRSVGAGFALRLAAELPLRALAAGADSEDAEARCAGRGERASAFAMPGLDCAAAVEPFAAAAAVKPDPAPALLPAAVEGFADAGRALLLVPAMRARAAAADEAAEPLAAGSFAAAEDELAIALAGPPGPASVVADKDAPVTTGGASERNGAAVSSGIEAAVATEAISAGASNADEAAASASVAEPIV